MLVSENSLLSKNSHKSSFNNDNNSVSYPSCTIVHPKLEMTEPGDADEQEADAAANEVMSGKVFRKFSGAGAGGGMAVSSQMESQLNQLQGGGQAMPDGLRGMMERGFDRDFSQVRLHTDGEAAGLSSSIHAKAFTHGNDIYFNQGQYAPETSEGQRLVAHELAHVAQGGGKVGRMSDAEKKWRTHYDIKYYIGDIKWIKDKVLGPSKYAKFKENYKKPSARVPVTVVFFTTEKLSDGAFERSLDSLFKYFESDKEKGKKILMIQGQPKMYGHKLIDIAVSYGPIESVVVAGHGSPWDVQLDESYSISTRDTQIFSNIAYAFNLSDEEKKGLKHSVLFDECLVGSMDYDDDRSLVDYAYTIINENRKDEVFVRGNKSKTWNDSTYYRDKSGFLKFKNEIDKTTTIDGKKIDGKKIDGKKIDGKKLSDSNHYNGPESDNYDDPNNPYAKTGLETVGLLLSNMRMADNLDGISHQNYCSDDLSQRKFMDDEHGRISNSLYIGGHKIWTKDLVRFIESKHCDMSMPSEELLYMKNFLKFLYMRRDTNRENRNYINENEVSSQLYLEFLYTQYNVLQDQCF